MTGIYKIINNQNGKSYIGGSVNIQKRWTRHRSVLNAGCHENIHLQRAWNLYGPASFTFEILEECSSDAVTNREQHWLDTTKPEYNILANARSVAGYKHSEEARRKMSEAQKGNTKKLGKPHSHETRQKIALAMRGKSPSAETRLKMSLAKRKPSPLGPGLENTQNV